MTDVKQNTQASINWPNKNISIKKGNGMFIFTNNAFLSGLQKSLYNFYKTGKFCDVTVACFDISYQAHSVILASGCSYFDKELESGEEEIYLPKSITASGFEPVLEYLYTGSLGINDETLPQIKAAAQLLGLKTVIMLCEAYRKMPDSNQSVNNTKNVEKNGSQSIHDVSNVSRELKKKDPDPAASSTLDCTKNIIPESLRSSLSVSVTSSLTNSTKTFPQIKRLNSGLEIIPISAPSDPKCPKRSDSSSHLANPEFNFEELDDLSDSEEDYSDEEGFSDYAEEEAILKKMEEDALLKKMKENEANQLNKKSENTCKDESKLEET